MGEIIFSDTPRFVAESLSAEIERRGRRVSIDTDPPIDTAYVHVVGLFGSDMTAWSVVADQSRPNRVGTVIVTDQHSVGIYRRGYRQGAAIAHVEAGPVPIVDMIIARSRGEILAPARLLAACVDDDVSLSPGEQLVLEHIAVGSTVAHTAEETFYSERHVRRLLQSILAKAGTSDRVEAVKYFNAGQ